jgi:hypothetical protein
MIAEERSEADAFLPLEKRQSTHTVWPYSLLPTYIQGLDCGVPSDGETDPFKDIGCLARSVR